MTVIEYKEAMIQAYKAAQHSPDPSTQNGAVLMNRNGAISSVAFNAFPWRVQELPERWERPDKYLYVEHAERNSIYHAAAAGAITAGSVMVCPWAACADCARAIVQAQVQILIRHRIPTESNATNDRWRDSVVVGDTIMREAGVEIIEVDPIPGYQLLRNGELKDTSEL